MSAILFRTALIGCILCMSGPSAVFGAVVPVNVDAVYLSAGKVTSSHVRDESHRIMPTIADRNSSGSIAVEPRGLFAVAAVLHRDPLTIDRIAPQSVLGNSVTLQTSAALNASILQTVQTSDAHFPASAFADGDIAVSADAFSDYFYGQPPERLTHLNRIGCEWFKAETSEVNHSVFPVVPNYGLIVHGATY